jgi:hypothetical protein
MKIFLLLLSILICSNLVAKDFDLPKDEVGKVVYTEVVQIDGVLKDELFDRAYSWVLKNANRELQTQVKADGIVIGSGHTPTLSLKKIIVRHNAGIVNYSISVAVKDGRYKYVFFHFEHEGATENSEWDSGGSLDNEKSVSRKGIRGMHQKVWNQIKEKTDEHIRALIISLKAAMLKKVEAW